MSNEKGVYPPVRTDADAVHPHVGFPVYGSEVQQDAFAVPFRGDLERAFVPQFVFRTEAFADTRER